MVGKLIVPSTPGNVWFVVLQVAILPAVGIDTSLIYTFQATSSSVGANPISSVKVNS